MGVILFLFCFVFAACQLSDAEEAARQAAITDAEASAGKKLEKFTAKELRGLLAERGAECRGEEVLVSNLV